MMLYVVGQKYFNNLMDALQHALFLTHGVQEQDYELVMLGSTSVWNYELRSPKTSNPLTFSDIEAVAQFLEIREVPELVTQLSFKDVDNVERFARCLQHIAKGSTGGKIDAITMLRLTTELSLIEAKNFVEKLMEVTW